MKSIKLIPAVFLFLFINLPSQAQNNVTLYANTASGQIQFAVDEIQTSLNEKGKETFVRPVLQISQQKNSEYSIILLNINDKAGLQLLKEMKVDRIQELKEEGFIIQKSGKNEKTFWILGKDDAGVIYGSLEITEIIRLRGIDDIENQLQNPYMKVRGTKFNIPLDVRTREKGR